MYTTLIICAVIAIIALLIFFGFIIYHQMLLLNEVNKRLMMQARESLEKERLTQEEYSNLVQEFNNRTDTKTQENFDLDMEEPFDPHNYS